MDTKLIGVVEGDWINPSRDAARLGASLAARAHGGQALFVPSLEQLPFDRLAGVVFSGRAQCTGEALANLDARGIGFVSIAANGWPEVSMIAGDMALSIASSVAFLLESGYKQIFHCFAETDPERKVFVAAFDQAMREHSHTPQGEFDARADKSVAEVQLCASELIDRAIADGTGPIAAFCPNEPSAIRALRAAQRAGLLIPEEFAVVHLCSEVNQTSFCEGVVGRVVVSEFNAYFSAADRLCRRKTNAVCDAAIQATAVFLKDDAFSKPDADGQNRLRRMERGSGFVRHVVFTNGARDVQQIETLAAELEEAWSRAANPALALAEFVVKSVNLGASPGPLHDLVDSFFDRIQETPRSNPHDFESLSRELFDIYANDFVRDGGSKNVFEKLERTLEKPNDSTWLARDGASVGKLFENVCRGLNIQRGCLLSFDQPAESVESVKSGASVWNTGTLSEPNPTRRVLLNGELPDQFLRFHSHAKKPVEIVPLMEDGYIWGLMTWTSNHIAARIVPTVAAELATRLKLCHAMRRANQYRIALSKSTRELEEQRRVAKVADEAKSEFLAIVSHEIRTPLNCIMGMTDLVGISSSDEEKREYLRLIAAAGGDLLSLVDDILDLSGMQRESVSLESEPFVVREIFDQVCAGLRKKAEDKGLFLESELDLKIPRVLVGDALRIRQVLFNLLANSVKFTERGGVVVKAELTATDPRNAEVTFEIRDSGIGIDPANQSRIFEPFEQADSSDSRLYEGAGLGLAIVKQLVDMMKGEVAFESGIGEGATFWLRLPLRLHSTEAEAAFSAEPACLGEGSAPYGTGRTKVLIVEENESNAYAIRQLLNRENCEVKIAEVGVDFREMEFSAFGLILVDLQMVDHSGLETVHFIRQDESKDGFSHRVPIVALAGALPAEYRGRCLDAGVDTFLSKPVDREALRKVLASIREGESIKEWRL